MLTYEQIIQKTITLDEAIKLFDPAFRSENKIVFSNGCFDFVTEASLFRPADCRSEQ